MLSLILLSKKMLSLILNFFILIYKCAFSLYINLNIVISYSLHINLNNIILLLIF